MLGKIARRFAVVGFFIMSGVYLLSLPAYYFLVAIPSNVVDFLLPFEVAACSLLSLAHFVWAGKITREIMKL